MKPPCVACSRQRTGTSLPPPLPSHKTLPSQSRKRVESRLCRTDRSKSWRRRMTTVTVFAPVWS